MQTASAFGRVEGGLSYFVKGYPQLAEWKSVLTRLDTFEQEIADNGNSRARLERRQGDGAMWIRCPNSP